MGDPQILELSKNVDKFDLELSEILKGVTSLSNFIPTCGDQIRTFLYVAGKMRDEVTNVKIKFLQNLNDEIVNRDISERKLRNAAGSNINLGKFVGYDSQMDFYTFRTQFRKLIEPTVQRKYWGDILKMNHLGGFALTLVEKIEDINGIWEKLKESFGNTRLLLQNKLRHLENAGGLWKIKGNEKIGIAIAALINTMLDLSALASEHKLENELYFGEGYRKVLSLIGDSRKWKLMSKDSSSDLTAKEEWNKLIEFLKRELKTCERLTLHERSDKCLLVESKPGGSRSPHKRDRDQTFNSSVNNNTIYSPKSLKCFICGKDDHIITTMKSGIKTIDYFSCVEFVNMTPAKRYLTLRNMGLCAKCLWPGAKFGSRHYCSKKYVCTHAGHTVHQPHVLVCNFHKNDKANLDLLESYKRDIIEKVPSLPQYNKNIGLSSGSDGANVASAFGGYKNNLGRNSSKTSEIRAIFMLQTIEINGHTFNIFYDSGCGDLVVKKSAIDILLSMGRAKHEIPGPITLTGVGDQKVVCKDGVYSLKLPLCNGQEAVVSGLCVNKITAEFPKYPLRDVETDFREKCLKIGGENLVGRLPKLPKFVGGETDIMLGIKYAKYFPKEVYSLPCRLAIYESVFETPGGTRGVLGGPHPNFTKIEREFGAHISNCSLFVEAELYKKRFQLEHDIPLLGVKKQGLCYGSVEGDPDEDSFYLNGGREIYAARKPPKACQLFDEIENAGTEVTYRCVECRSCPECKRGERLDSVSIQEEVEQSLIVVV